MEGAGEGRVDGSTRRLIPLRQHGLGDNLMSVTNIPGDSFRHIHDKVKTVINSFCVSSSIPAECEVFGLFRDLLPVQALEEDGLQRGRNRQGLLPDFRLELGSRVQFV